MEQSHKTTKSKKNIFKVLVRSVSVFPEMITSAVYRESEIIIVWNLAH